MINAVRSLLMNRGRDGYDHAFPGEEFVDPAFVRRKLPTHLLRAHQTLFGRDPDRFFLNYRLRQLMSLLHTADFEEDVLAFDPRVTYLPLDSEELFDTAFNPDIVQLGHTDTLYVAGTFEADEGLGLAQQIWRIESIAPGTLRIDRQRPRATQFDITYAATGGLTMPIMLPGSALTVRFRNVPNGTAWRISVAGRLQTDLSQILERLTTSLGDRGVSQLFPPLSGEPVATYQKIWNEHPYFVNRFAALLLAIAVQIAAAPQDV